MVATRTTKAATTSPAFSIPDAAAYTATEHWTGRLHWTHYQATTHAMRNEMAEELPPDLEGKSQMKLNAAPLRGGKTSGRESETGRR